MRTITAPNLAQVTAEGAVAVEFIELAFSTTVRLTTAPVDLTWGGNTFTGSGMLLSIGAVEETDDQKAQSVELRLSGVDQSIIAVLLGEVVRGKLATIWRGWYVNGALVDTPLLLFKGYLNESFDVEEGHRREGGGRTCDIRTRLVSRFAQFDQPRGIRCNVESHQRWHTGDTFFQNVPKLANLRIVWPNKSFWE